MRKARKAQKTKAAGPALFDSGLRKLSLVVIVGTVMSTLDLTIVTVALTPLARDLHSSLPVIQWTVTAYALAMSMAIPLSGWAVERFGAKTAWLTCLLLFTAGSALCGVSWNVTGLIVFRVLQGAGGGMIGPIGQIMLAKKAGPGRMSMVMAVIAVPAMLCPVFGPVLGGLILTDLPWRWMFYVNIPVGLVGIALAMRLLPREAGSTAAHVDGRGLALLSPGLAAMVYGLSEAGSDNTQLAIWAAAGLLLTLAFVRHALAAETPLVTVRGFARRAFAMSSAVMFAFTGATFGFLVVMPVYYQVVRGFSPLHAGLLIVPLGLGAVVTLPLSGRLGDRHGARWLVTVGLAVIITAAAALAQMHASTSVVLLAGATFGAGLGEGLVLAPVMGAAYQGTPPAEVAAASATMEAVIRVGSSFGAAALAVILQQAIRSRIRGASGSLSGIAASVHGSPMLAPLTSAFGVTFWWVAGIVAVALIPGLLIPSPAGRRRLPFSREPGGSVAAGAGLCRAAGLFFSGTAGNITRWLRHAGKCWTEGRETAAGAGAVP